MSCGIGSHWENWSAWLQWGHKHVTSRQARRAMVRAVSGLVVAAATVAPVWAEAPAAARGRNGERPEDVKHWLERVAGVRTVNPTQRDHASVRAAFQEVVAEPRKYTVRVLGNDVQVALGTVVDADGYVLTKASELQGKLACVFSDGRQVTATIVGVDDEYDLALLHADADGLPVAQWSVAPPPTVGSLLATPSQDLLPTAIGIVSVAPRKISALSGFLGVSLDAQQARIAQILTGGGAEKAGLKVNDLILKVNGADITDRESLQKLIRRYPPGQRLSLAIQRGNQQLTVAAVLGDAPSSAANERAEMQNRLGGQLSQRRVGFPQVLQHDTVLRPNECGGPLVDLDGQVVAVNIARAGRVASYAVPASVVLGLVEELKAGKNKPEVLAQDASTTKQAVAAMP